MNAGLQVGTLRRRQLLSLGTSSVGAAGLAACGGGGQSPVPDAVGTPPPTDNPEGSPATGDPVLAAKSAKRGIAYDLANPDDLAVLAHGVSWWYAWGLRPNAAVPADFRSRFGMDFHPMLWNGNFATSEVESYLLAHPDIKHLLLLNEPNLTDQANLTPSQAAQLWPRFESIASRTGVKLVGPAITWAPCPDSVIRSCGWMPSTASTARRMATAIRKATSWRSTGMTTDSAPSLIA